MQKKVQVLGMNSLFSYDNKFFQAINKIADCFFLSVLWVLFSIPIITAGGKGTIIDIQCKILVNGGILCQI